MPSLASTSCCTPLCPIPFHSSDRATQLTMSNHDMTVTGFKGYAMARATQGLPCTPMRLVVAQHPCTRILGCAFLSLSLSTSLSLSRPLFLSFFFERPTMGIYCPALVVWWCATGVFQGNWYFEVEVGTEETEPASLPDTKQPHWRIGWAQRHGLSLSMLGSVSVCKSPFGFSAFPPLQLQANIQDAQMIRANAHPCWLCSTTASALWV